MTTKDVKRRLEALELGLAGSADAHMSNISDALLLELMIGFEGEAAARPWPDSEPTASLDEQRDVHRLFEDLALRLGDGAAIARMGTRELLILACSGDREPSDGQLGSAG